MRKLLLTLLLSACGVATILAQGYPFEKGDKIISLGYGLGNTLHGAGYSTKMAPISATFEYALADGLLDDKAGVGVGGYLGVSSSKYGYWEYGKNNYLRESLSDVMLGATLNFHYQFVDKLDTYTGITLGYDIVISDKTPQGMAKSQMAFIWKAGAKYYFLENLAVMGEVGWGAAILNLGLAYNIKAY